MHYLLRGIFFAVIFNTARGTPIMVSLSNHEPFERSKQALVLRLHEIGAIKFGSFKLKSGIISPIYFDLRVIVSYPDVLQTIADCMWESLESTDFDFVCGVPYTALPIATAISLSRSMPMVMKRKEAKEYGTKKMVEGVFKAGDSCLVIEDVITSGASILETIESLEKEGLRVKGVMVCIDRQQGGTARILEKGYPVAALFSIAEILEIAADRSLISQQQFLEIEKFIANNQCT